MKSNPLTPILELLADNLSAVLPASGGAVESLLQPDTEEMDDLLINQETRTVTEFLETPTPDPAKLYRPTPPLYRDTTPCYRFFVDGSIRSYYLGTGIESNRSFPIELAQIGATVMERQNDGSVLARASRQRILLLLPKGPLGVSDTVWKRLITLNPADNSFQIVDTTENNSMTKDAPTVEALRSRAGAIARNRMHKLEIEIISETDTLRHDTAWLILDGSVKLDNFIDAPHLIGVAKSFHKNPEFRFGPKNSDRHRLDISRLLAHLPYAHRTVAFSAHNGKVAFWYVRIREQHHVEYPLMGVVKVELPRPRLSDPPPDAALIDHMSRTLVAERNVTPHGSDHRWHCHLYPIFLAEQAIKNNFYSYEVMRGLIRWPQRVFTIEPSERSTA